LVFVETPTPGKGLISDLKHDSDSLGVKQTPQKTYNRNDDHKTQMRRLKGDEIVHHYGSQQVLMKTPHAVVPWKLGKAKTTN
jgi:hypothetical protein